MKQTLPILMLFAFFSAPAGAALVAYDGLNAPAGPLEAVGSGWNLLPWDVQNDKPGYQVTSAGLTFGSLQVVGNKAIGGDSYVSAGLLIKMPATWEPSNEWVPWRKLDGDGRYKAGAEGTTLWASFLVRQDVSNTTFNVSFAQSHIGWNPGAEGAKVGLNSSGVWTLSEIGGGPSVSTGVARVLSQIYLMVLKIEFLTEGSDRVTLFVNPTPGLAAPDVTGASITTTKDFCLYNVQFYPGSGLNNGAMDELRFGGTFADVTPVPEPATLLLLGLGATGVFRRRG